MKTGLTLKNQSFRDLQDSLQAIHRNSSISIHIALEQAISSSRYISEDQRMQLFSSLFNTSLTNGTYQPRYIMDRINGLIMSPLAKKKLIHSTFFSPDYQGQLNKNKR